MNSGCVVIKIQRYQTKGTLYLKIKKGAKRTKKNSYEINAGNFIYVPGTLRG
jgi:hypothetical protein